MCIRDSFKVMRSSNHEGNFLAVLNRQVDVATSNSEMTGKMKEKSPEKLEQIRIPVSYTHLDVYKRQGHLRHVLRTSGRT